MTNADFAPNLFLCAAPKTASTTIYEMLKRGGDIAVSRPKEPEHFLISRKPDMTQYRRELFKSYAGEAVVLDGCPRNLFFRHAMQSIHIANPDAGFIAIVRDPVKRLYSHWWHWYGRKRTPLGFLDTFERERENDLDAIIKSPKDYEAVYASSRLSGCGYILECGNYARHIERGFDLFGRQKFLVLVFEDVIADVYAALDGIRAFAGLEQKRTDVEIAHKNPSSKYGDRPQLNSDDAAKMADYYRADTARLSDILGRKLDWLSA